MFKMCIMDELSKLKKMIISAILFIVFASPVLFSYSQQYIGNTFGLTLVRGGVPTLTGIGLHAVVFALLLKWVWGRRGNGMLMD